MKLYYPKKGRLINILKKNKRFDNKKKIYQYIINKECEKDGLYDIRKYYNILDNKENYFKVELFKINYKNDFNKNMTRTNIENILNKIKCEYI